MPHLSVLPPCLPASVFTHVMAGDSREARKVICLLKITNTCFERLDAQRNPAHVRKDRRYARKMHTYHLSQCVCRQMYHEQLCVTLRVWQSLKLNYSDKHDNDKITDEPFSRVERKKEKKKRLNKLLCQKLEFIHNVKRKLSPFQQRGIWSLQHEIKSEEAGIRIRMQTHAQGVCTSDTRSHTAVPDPSYSTW